MLTETKLYNVDDFALDPFLCFITVNLDRLFLLDDTLGTEYGAKLWQLIYI